MSLDSGAYDRFAVVVFGTPEIVEAVERVRRALPPSGRAGLTWEILTTFPLAAELV